MWHWHDPWWCHHETGIILDVVLHKNTGQHCVFSPRCPVCMFIQKQPAQHVLETIVREYTRQPHIFYNNHCAKFTASPAILTAQCVGSRGEKRPFPVYSIICESLNPSNVKATTLTQQSVTWCVHLLNYTFTKHIFFRISIIS